MLSLYRASSTLVSVLDSVCRAVVYNNWVIAVVTTLIENRRITV